MGALLFFIWYMVAILPFLIFMHGYEMLNKFFAKRGVNFTMLHLILLILIIFFILFWLLGYR